MLWIARNWTMGDPVCCISFSILCISSVLSHVPWYFLEKTLYERSYKPKTKMIVSYQSIIIVYVCRLWAPFHQVLTLPYWCYMLHVLCICLFMDKKKLLPIIVGIFCCFTICFLLNFFVVFLAASAASPFSTLVGWRLRLRLRRSNPVVSHIGCFHRTVFF